MSGRTLALALTLAICCGLAAGCTAGLELPPIFVTPQPAAPGSAGPQAFPTAAPQALPLAALPGLLAGRPQAVSTAPGQALASATRPALPAVTQQAPPTAAPAVPTGIPPAVATSTPPALPAATPQAVVAATAQTLPTATRQALATAIPQALPAATGQVLATAPVTQTHVINVPGQPFTFRVPAGWTVQEVASISPGMVLTADWTSPDNWDSPPPAGVVAHVAAVGAQPIPADMTDADLAKAAQPDQLAAELKVMLQSNCGPAANLDAPLPIQIAGQPGMWMHCRATIDGRAMHLIAASAVRGRSTVALMGLAVDPAPWSELAPIYEAIIKSIQATD